jgi:hypothetical protein
VPKIDSNRKCKTGRKHGISSVTRVAAGQVSSEPLRELRASTGPLTPASEAYMAKVAAERGGYVFG